MSAREYDCAVGVQLGFAIMLPVCARQCEGPPASCVSGVGAGVLAQPQSAKAASKAAHVRMDMEIRSAWFDNKLMIRAFL